MLKSKMLSSVVHFNFITKQSEQCKMWAVRETDCRGAAGVALIIQ